ncbi:Abhydrolase domain-containing protein 8 [Dufourea novaeangliae]|uniref:acylglycerol lipase n=1 Tax=Dufourea novaeangliae TaxID=178035 RepID=A0A154PDN7_DUFNO|nr:Abhydrolase domain-containing protein 8 [Dufourea novaeangliae]
MAAEGEASVMGAPWYTKFFEYWRNRNRVGPGKVELLDCDFFIVGPRRTLRILRPSLKSGWYYENTTDRPESVVDNFFTRWSRRPHSSGNCRCSFRQSRRFSTTEEQIITAELNRIRTSLCEAEKNERAIEELEQRVSVNLQRLNTPENQQTKPEDSTETRTRTESQTENDQQVDEQTIKNKIVKDLEKYINVLLEEILDDTVKYIVDSEDALIKDITGSKQRKERRSSEDKGTTDESKLSSEEPATGNEQSFNAINFSFRPTGNAKGTQCKNEILSNEEGYINRGFIGSTTDPDSLDFYLRRSTGTDVTCLEQLDCIDSGINSVETIEFQPDQEPSLEQSLLRIIDEKLGRTPSKNDAESDGEPRAPSVETAGGGGGGGGIDISTDNLEDGRREQPTVEPKELEEIVNEPSFENLRLEFKGKPNDESWNEKMAAFQTKRDATSIELDDYRKMWPDIEETSTAGYEPNPRDLVTFRRNRKPMIVFLHGFGSSAEIFEHQLRYFSALGYPCIAPDMLGHGMSSAPGRSRDYHFNKLLMDLDTVLCHYAFKPGQKCVLVAHNYGCSFAAALACKYDSRIRQLVLISGGGPTPLAAPSTESTGHCCLRAILAPFLMCGLHRNILYTARGRQHPYCGPEPPEQWPSHMKYVLDGMTMLKAFLEAIPAAGHTPMTDCPEQVNHMIHCFIDLWNNKKW